VKINKGSATLELVEGNIVTQEVDAIVNAANHSLLGGGGVDGAIHRAGGPEILEACRKLGGCDTGDAKITTGGRLPARYVIHTVGPIYWKEGARAATLLASAYRRSLEVAAENGLQSIAFPSVSTGAYGYPLEEAALIALQTVMNYLGEHEDGSVQHVRFVLFGRRAHRVYEESLAQLLRQAG
jgi:O-acetyl-ADP-ribose deacetylase (regulator of RNase III)